MSLKRVCAFIATATVVLATAADAQETMKVGITTTGIPFTFVDMSTLKPTGAMVDLANAIAVDNGAQTEFQISAFPSLIPELTTGKIDLISAAMFTTDKREEVIDFSMPVYQYGEAMFVAEGDPKDYTRDELKGEVVGAPIGSTTADALRATGLFREVRQYDSIADIMRDVKLGRIKAGFADRPIVAYQISQRSGLGVRLVGGYQPMQVGTVALAVAKGNDKFLDRINRTLSKLKENGSLSRIFSRYGL